MPDKDLTRYGLVGSPTTVERIFAPPGAEKQVYIAGDAAQKSRQLYDLLRKKKYLI